MLAEKAFADTFKTLEGDKSKLLPPDYKDFLKEQPLIANKQFYFMAKLSRKDALGPDIEKIILTHFKAGYKMNKFLLHAISA